MLCGVFNRYQADASSQHVPIMAVRVPYREQVVAA